MCEFVAVTWTLHHTYNYVYFRFFVSATENGTFSAINISKTIAGATVPIESLIHKLQENAKIGRKRHE